MANLGPSSASNHSFYNTKALLKYTQKCTQYVSNLDLLQKYVLWRYTIGSASINSYLIFGKVPDNAKYWCHLFFLYFHNTYPNVKHIPLEESPFRNYKKFFINPNLFLEVNDKGIIEDIIYIYISILNFIIVGAPSPSKPITVFKVASKYPGLPDGVGAFKEHQYEVEQLPFNSTTIDPNFNFAVFVSQETLNNSDVGCCLFKITIPPNVPCLYVPQEFHAYPFENEVILLPGVVFNINSAEIIDMKYIDPASVKTVLTQDKNNISMGPVYELNTYSPCGTNACAVKNKPFHVYNVTLSNIY